MARDSRLHVLMLGRSGSGKGTQSEILARAHHLYHISVGDLFRSLAGGESDTGRRVADIIHRGGLPPQWIASYLWIRELIEHVSPHQGILIDGAPRRREEAERMIEVFTWYGRVNIHAIYLAVSEEEAIRRLRRRKVCGQCAAVYSSTDTTGGAVPRCPRCGGEFIVRRDDYETAIKERMKWFSEIEHDLLSFFEEKNILRRINGEQPVENVAADIRSLLA